MCFQQPSLLRSANLDSSDLECAKSNLLEHFAFVGLQERFPEAVIAIADLLGEEAEVYLTRNKTRAKPNQSILTQRDLETVAELNRYDFQLFEAAKKLYYERYHTPSLRRRARNLEARSKEANQTAGDNIHAYR